MVLLSVLKMFMTKVHVCIVTPVLAGTLLVIAIKSKDYAIYGIIIAKQEASLLLLFGECMFVSIQECN